MRFRIHKASGVSWPRSKAPPPPPSLLLLFRPHPQDQGADQTSRRITARKMVIPVRSRTRCCARLPPKPGHLRPQFTHPGGHHGPGTPKRCPAGRGAPPDAGIVEASEGDRICPRARSPSSRAGPMWVPGPTGAIGHLPPGGPAATRPLQCRGWRCQFVRRRMGSRSHRDTQPLSGRTRC